jgi:hypothetical protein
MKLQAQLDALSKVNTPAPTFGARTYCSLEYNKDGTVARSPEWEEWLKKRNSLDEDSCCSFNEWAAANYRIRKGEKSFFKDILGVPQFTKEQVYKSYNK